MSCLNTKQKLLLLCCCAAAVAIISSVMVINAFFQWKKPQNDFSIQPTTVVNPENLPTDAPQVFTNAHQKDSDLDIEIDIIESATQKSKSTTQLKRKWFIMNSTTKLSSKSYLNANSDEEEDDNDDGDSNDGSGSGDISITVTLPMVTKTTTPSNAKSSSINKTDLSITNIAVSNTTEGYIFIDDNLSQDNSSGNSITGLKHIGGTHFPHSPTQDRCDQWLHCEDPFLKNYLQKFSNLPSCPCIYPLTRSDTLWDDSHQKMFKWKDSKFSESYMAAYHQGAKLCIRSEVEPGSLAAQNCCYDEDMKLITRGAGAGTPDIISPDISEELHKLVDKLPWILCKGDWTRYNKARPPNNIRQCTENPVGLAFLYQVYVAKNT